MLWVQVDGGRSTGDGGSYGVGFGVTPAQGGPGSSSHRLLIHPNLRACCRGSEVRCPETSFWGGWGRAGVSMQLQQGVLGPGTW